MYLYSDYSVAKKYCFVLFTPYKNNRA